MNVILRGGGGGGEGGGGGGGGGGVHSNGHTIGFHSQTQKLELHKK